MTERRIQTVGFAIIKGIPLIIANPTQKVNTVNPINEAINSDLDTLFNNLFDLIENINILSNYIIKKRKKQAYYADKSNTHEIIKLTELVIRRHRRRNFETDFIISDDGWGKLKLNSLGFLC